MEKPKFKWWSVSKVDIGRELANPGYVQWADERIAALEQMVDDAIDFLTSHPRHSFGCDCWSEKPKPCNCDNDKIVDKLRSLRAGKGERS